MISGLSGQDYELPYDLDNPSEKYKIPSDLEEISGIRLIDDIRVACIQDEAGEIFIYNLEKREIEQRIPFGNDNDYEDIAIVGSDAYVLESDGDIHMVRNFLEEEEPQVDKNENALEMRNNCEGLCYQKATHSLLIACKGHAGLDKDRDLKDYRAVYRFSLDDEKLVEAPVMLIKMSDLLNYSNLNIIARISYKLASRMDPSGDIRFQPSAIDIHPQSGYIYIMSFIGRLLTVYDENAHLVAAEKLNRLVFMQPEGMDFDKDGNMYISNESNGGQANILFFELKN
ncbi:MAG: SdiA-regulated domain-containing protein [Bacteroidales bacterium]|nr:SdiA-regulated domain-containing protein [Bacteroidales bacterium]MCF8333166.1 SdiA-regulated domain-containing protein [Bacteroidales bacterium]